MNISSHSNILPTIAAFDFDETLTDRDSLFPFLKQVVGTWRFYWGLLVLSPILLAYGLRLIPNWKAKEAVLRYFIGGLSVDRLQTLSQDFARKTISKLLRPEALKRLQWHQKQGHMTILVSASLEVYLQPWAKEIGFDRVLGTQLEILENRVTGRIRGKNCHGREKVDRLQDVLGNLSQYSIYAYGDSSGDKQLLEVADYPYYRKFSDDEEPIAKGQVIGWERGLMLSVVLAVALYLIAVLWSGADRVLAALNLLPFWLIPSLLGVIFFGYYLRFWRWQWYLKEMGYSVPVGSSFRIFLASFALTASPAKAGESIKSVMLKRRHDVAIAPTLAGLFCERFTDAFSVVLLVCAGLSSFANFRWAIATIVALQVIAVFVLQNPKVLKRHILKPLARGSKLRKIAQKIETSIDSASTLLQPRILAGSTGLALVAWGLEGVALYFIFQGMGATSVTVYQAILIHTASGLIGALSLTPGGIGGAEASAIGLSMLYGVDRTVAVTATFLIRLMTLWFAVAVGIVAMLAEQNRLAAPKT
ncbi:MAG TPA: HAD-IB family hydrolase [Oscillatoriales cyanobacterium M59_W2019_021]|nr:HAD-IB family hydrolase [Oscillatoriales cyanobacterium M4454_W2019_049]HIK51842.1 HAD-IB family hydrolase [Oscillatoriales cyanobacterium M59_W2019_021]